jgi:small subunit ribosomal protein S4
MGIAPSRRGAVNRFTDTLQLMVVNIPSYHLKPGDKVAVRENLNH